MRADSALSFHQNTRGSEELAGVFLSQRHVIYRRQDPF